MVGHDAEGQMTVEQRLAKARSEWRDAIGGDEMDMCNWAIVHAPWLLCSMQAVCEAARSIVDHGVLPDFPAKVSFNEIRDLRNALREGEGKS